MGVKPTTSGVLVRRFLASSDQPAARHVILEGMREHWGTLDPTLNRDLDDIELSYANCVFLVAERDGAVVATGALVPRENNGGEIVRMSTLNDYRRLGIGRSILLALISEARALGHTHVRLSTNADWLDALSFYERCGMIRMPGANPHEARFELTL